MNSLSILNRRQVGLFAAAGALLLAVIVPAIVSAAQLTERSIALSSSSAAATDVTYKVIFTPDADAEAFTIDFCSESPIIGQACTTPAGFSATGADSATVDAPDANTLVITQEINADAAVSVDLEGINNPTAVGPIYARIITYNTAANAALHNPALATNANRVDEGGAAISITNTIGVSGAVLESMTFCVSGQAISDGCTGTSAPTLKLGQQVGDIFALTPGTMSEGSIFTQISTNAASGAVVSLKSSTLGCGGLVRAGAANCDIDPALNTNVTDTDTSAKFGVKPLAASNGGTGIFRPFESSPGVSYYSPSAFKMNWIVGDGTGVTSTFGDPFLDTASAPATNKNVELKFGASVTNETPAGLYSADLNLIATGKF
jgi:hypothetical protein